MWPDEKEQGQYLQQLLGRADIGLFSSTGGVGLTTAEMQDIGPFLEAGWDFVDETENGAEDIWWILEGQDYPRLWWELIEDDIMK